MTEHLIILAGGASSRMKKSTSSQLSKAHIEQANSRSKALIMLHNRPMLDYLLFNAEEAGIKNIYLVIGKDGEHFKSNYGKQDYNNVFRGLSISYVTQIIPEGRIKPLGTADAIFQALQQYSTLKQKQFLVCNCDNLYSVEAFMALRQTQSPNAFINYDRSALKYPQERVERFALTKTSIDNYLKNIIEKPTAEEVIAFKDNQGKLRVSMNIFKFDGFLFFPFLKTCPIHSKRNEKELPTALLNMQKLHPHSTIGIPFSEHVPDLTGKDDIIIMNKYLAKHPLNINSTKK